MQFRLWTRSTESPQSNIVMEVRRLILGWCATKISLDFFSEGWRASPALQGISKKRDITIGLVKNVT